MSRMPTQNGHHERMHLTLKSETTRPPGMNSLQQQDRFDESVREFNTGRPHGALAHAAAAELCRHRLGAEEPATYRQPVRRKGATYVLGTFPHPYLRAGQQSAGGGSGIRTHDLWVMRQMKALAGPPQLVS